MDSNDLIQAYSKDPVGNMKPQDFCCSYMLGNSVCGDDIEVFLTIDDGGCVIDFGYLGHPSMFTITAASLLAEDLFARKKLPIRSCCFETSHICKSFDFLSLHAGRGVRSHRYWLVEMRCISGYEMDW